MDFRWKLLWKFTVREALRIEDFRLQIELHRAEAPNNLKSSICNLLRRLSGRAWRRSILLLLLLQLSQQLLGSFDHRPILSLLTWLFGLGLFFGLLDLRLSLGVIFFYRLVVLDLRHGLEVRILLETLLRRLRRYLFGPICPRHQDNFFQGSRIGGRAEQHVIKVRSI